MAESEKDPLASSRGDWYHQGVITKLFPSNNTGVVRTESGRELTFSYDLVVLVGAVKSALELKVGEQVGYDLGWTSAGLRLGPWFYNSHVSVSSQSESGKSFKKAGK
jgi:hypothetical protein